MRLLKNVFLLNKLSLCQMIRAPPRKTSTQGLHRATRVQVTPSSQSDAESKQKKSHLKRAPLKPTVAQWGSLENTMDDARSCSSASLLEDVRRMVKEFRKRTPKNSRKVFSGSAITTYWHIQTDGSQRIFVRE